MKNLLRQVVLVHAKLVHQECSKFQVHAWPHGNLVAAVNALNDQPFFFNQSIQNVFGGIQGELDGYRLDLLLFLFVLLVIVVRLCRDDLLLLQIRTQIEQGGSGGRSAFYQGFHDGRGELLGSIDGGTTARGLVLRRQKGADKTGLGHIIRKYISHAVKALAIQVDGGDFQSNPLELIVDFAQVGFKRIVGFPLADLLPHAARVVFVETVRRHEALVEHLLTLCEGLGHVDAFSLSLSLAQATTKTRWMDVTTRSLTFWAVPVTKPMLSS